MFYKASDKGLEDKLAKVTAKSTRFGEIFDITRDQFGGLRERLADKDAVGRSIVSDSCATFVLSV